MSALPPIRYVQNPEININPIFFPYLIHYLSRVHRGRMYIKGQVFGRCLILFDILDQPDSRLDIDVLLVRQQEEMKGLLVKPGGKLQPFKALHLPEIPVNQYALFSRIFLTSTSSSAALFQPSMTMIQRLVPFSLRFRSDGILFKPQKT